MQNNFGYGPPSKIYLFFPIINIMLSSKFEVARPCCLRTPIHSTACHQQFELNGRLFPAVLMSLRQLIPNFGINWLSILQGYGSLIIFQRFQSFSSVAAGYDQKTVSVSVLNQTLLELLATSAESAVKTAKKKLSTKTAFFQCIF